MRILTCSVLLMIQTGCTLMPGKRAPEPPIIVIKNSCSVDFAEVILKEPRDQGGLVSMGSVSPVLRQAPFVYRRPTDPPPLLPKLKIIWTTRSGRTYTDIVDLKTVLHAATGEPDEALILDIQRAGRVQVYIDRLSTL
ncbi:hypothetical protein ACFL6U_32820 [Planctomycetota bacterium]